MPRRHDHLFGRIANFQALHAAARRAVKGKRKKPGAAAFFANLEGELLALERQLRAGIYRPGRYVAFEVNDPKKRIVSAAPFRDRVVHHALCAAVEPIFEAGFIDHTFANRIGKGTHRAIEVYERYRDRHAHVLHCDIYRFPAIDHAVLKSDFRRRISCARTLALLNLIVDSSNAQEPVNLYFRGDDLFAPFLRRRGLPIGNLTSQFFANLYLNGFDHFVTEVLRAPYVRYVDDFALFHDDPTVLVDWRLRIEQYLVGRRLKLHPRKTTISSCNEPAQFLGFELLPDGGRHLPAEAQKHLAEALEQQTATSEVLQIISSSSGELEPVFQAMLSNATSICKAKFGTLWLCEGDAFRAVALHNAPPAYAEARRREFRLRPPPNTALGRVASTKQVVHVADIRTHSYDPDWLAAAELAKYRMVVSVPMLKDNELIGAINTDISQIESRSAAQSGKVDGRRLPGLCFNEYVDSGQAH
jgi:RNA-directed DNA polymerase